MTDDTAKDPPDNEVVYVGFWARFMAFILDSFAVALLLAPVATQVMGEMSLAEYDLGDAQSRSLLLNALLMRSGFDVLLVGTIFIMFWIFRNATPGKMILDCVIVDASTLAAPTVAQNILRYVMYYLSLIPLGLGFVWIGFDARKQGWHDKIAGTVVIKGKPRTPDENP